VALSDEKTWNVVGGNVIADAKASASVAKTIHARTEQIIKLAEEGALPTSEVKKALTDYTKNVKAEYGAMVKDLAEMFPDYRASVAEVEEILLRAKGEIHESETKAAINSILENARKKESFDIEHLYKLRKSINAQRAENYETREVIRNTADIVDSLINRATESLADDDVFKQAFKQQRENYSSIFRLKENEVYRDYVKIIKSPEERSELLFKAARADEDALNGITGVMTPEQRAGTEMQIIAGIVKRSVASADDATGQMAINFKAMNEALNEINIANIKSTTAKKKIEALRELSRVFKMDAQILSDVKGSKIIGASQGIATTIEGRLHAMRISIFMRILKLMMPTIGGNKYALARHVMKGLRKARTPKDIVFELENFPDLPPSLWKQLRPIIDEQKELTRLEKEAEAQAQVAKEQAEEIVKQERLAKQAAEKEALAKEVENFQTPSAEEVRAVASLTPDDQYRNFSQLTVKIQDGTATPPEIEKYIKARQKIAPEKLRQKMETKAALDEYSQENVKLVQANKDIIKDLAGVQEREKGLSNADIQRNMESEDDVADAYRGRFDGEEQSTYGYFDEKTAQSALDGDEDAIMEVAEGLKQAKEDGFKIKTADEIIQDINNIGKKKVEDKPKTKPIAKTKEEIKQEPKEPVDFGGTATPEEQVRAFREMDEDSKKEYLKKKQKNKIDQMQGSNGQKYIEEKLGYRPEKADGWKTAFKDGEQGAVDHSSTYMYETHLKDDLDKFGLKPVLNKDSKAPLVYRGRAISVENINGTKKIYVDGIEFEEIHVGRWKADKELGLFKTMGDKYAVAKGISDEIDSAIPELEKHADVFLEPYGASLSFTFNLRASKQAIKDGKPYYVGVSSFFEPEKYKIYSMLSNGGTEAAKKIKKVMQRILDDDKLFYWAKDKDGKDVQKRMAKENFEKYVSQFQEDKYRKIVGLDFGDRIEEFNNDFIYDLLLLFEQKPQIEKALRRIEEMAEMMSQENFHILDNLDNQTLKMAKEFAEQGKKVALIDDSNYASLINEMSDDVYARFDTTLKALLDNKKITQEEFDEVKNFADKNGIDMDDQFGKNPQYLLWQKQKVYDAILENNGIVIATNNANPELVRGLAHYEGDTKVFLHSSQSTLDIEDGIYLRNKRPETLTILGAKNVNKIQGRETKRFGTRTAVDHRASGVLPEAGGKTRLGESEIHRRGAGVSGLGDRPDIRSGGRGGERRPEENSIQYDKGNESVKPSDSKKPKTAIDYINEKLQLSSSEDAPIEYPTMNGQTLPKQDKQGNLRDPYTGDKIFSIEEMMKTLSKPKPTTDKDKQVIDFLKSLGL